MRLVINNFTGVVRELMLNGGGDDDMGTLLAMMHSAPADALILKGHILKVSSIITVMFLMFLFNKNTINNLFLVCSAMFTRKPSN